MLCLRGYTLGTKRNPSIDSDRKLPKHKIILPEKWQLQSKGSGKLIQRIATHTHWLEKQPKTLVSTLIIPQIRTSKQVGKIQSNYNIIPSRPQASNNPALRYTEVPPHNFPSLQAQPSTPELPSSPLNITKSPQQIRHVKNMTKLPYQLPVNSGKSLRPSFPRTLNVKASNFPSRKRRITKNGNLRVSNK